MSSVKVGDRVAIEAGIYCKACRACKEGRYNLCKVRQQRPGGSPLQNAKHLADWIRACSPGQNMKFASSAKVHPHLDGTLRERMNHPATLLHKLPDSCSFEAAALAEPLSVVIHAIRRSKLQAGERVLVLGAGAVGLLAASLAKASGATTVVAVDIEAARLEFAQRNGWATSTYCLPKGPRVSGAEALEAAKGVWEELKADTSVTGVEDLDQGFDVVFECTGVESCMQAAVFVSTASSSSSNERWWLEPGAKRPCFIPFLPLQATRPGGRVLYVGMGTSAMLLPTGASLIREVDIMGVFRYANTYPAALALLGSGQLGDVEKMVTQRYPLERAEEAFQDILRGKDQQGNMIVKVMVEGPKQ